MEMITVYIAEAIDEWLDRELELWGRREVNATQRI